MDSAEVQDIQPSGNIKGTEEKETQNGEQVSKHKHICYTCLFGTVLGISALAVCYLVLFTAIAFAIP